MKSKLGKKNFRQLSTATHGMSRTRRPLPLRPGDAAILRRLREKRSLKMFFLLQRNIRTKRTRS